MAEPTAATSSICSSSSSEQTSPVASHPLTSSSSEQTTSLASPPFTSSSSSEQTSLLPLTCCYIWGSVDWSQPLNTNNTLVLPWPVAFTALNALRLPSILHVSCGLKHTFLVTGSGQLLCFGNNAKGQLGLSHLPYTYEPTAVTLPEHGGAKAVEVACGATHTLVRMDDGKVWSFGANTNGQLGRLSRAKASCDPCPGRVLGALEFLKATQIAAGGETSYAVTDTGDLFAWGSIQYGALGLGYNGVRLETAGKETVDDEERPTPVVWFREHGVKIAKVVAGARHLLVLAADGALYTCGHGAYGRLGQGIDTHDKLSPVRVPLPSTPTRPLQVLDVVSSSVSEHSLCLAKVGGHVFVYFWGRPGNDNDGVTKPMTVDSLCGQGVSCVATGRGMSMCCTGDGEAAIWGENQLSSCLGLLGEQKNKRVEPKVLEVFQGRHVVKVYCGGWHMMAFTDPSRSAIQDIPLVIPEKGRVVKSGGFTSKAWPFEELAELFHKKCSEGAPLPETATTTTSTTTTTSSTSSKKRGSAAATEKPPKKRGK